MAAVLFAGRFADTVWPATHVLVGVGNFVVTAIFARCVQIDTTNEVAVRGQLFSGATLVFADEALGFASSSTGDIAPVSLTFSDGLILPRGNNISFQVFISGGPPSVTVFDVNVYGINTP
jgi:hypothetical protein